MTPNEQAVAGAVGAVIGLVGWFVRRTISGQDTRLTTLEKHVGELKTQMAAHDANKQLLDSMYTELRELTKLTNRIAGHLKID